MLIQRPDESARRTPLPAIEVVGDQKGECHRRRSRPAPTLGHLELELKRPAAVSLIGLANISNAGSMEAARCELSVRRIS
jgi:hypothetical protein